MRKSGVLMHITSLPGAYGIGTLGKEAFAFVDFLEAAGQSYWQILPLTPTGYGDSPYQSCSAYAGNHYLINLELLVEEGLLLEEELANVTWCHKDTKADFGLLYNNRLPVLRKAYARFRDSEALDAFCKENADWLADFALFMALKERFGGKPWYQWEEELKFRRSQTLEKARTELAEQIRFYSFVQYLFDRQWTALRGYAKEHGIRIIGDVPIYVPLDSVEVWSEPELFQLDEQLRPIKVAGCPPDAFTADGQLWGNPIFNWDRMKQDNYRWWVGRMRFAKQLYDIVRIDHFIGFNSYYAIPFGSKTAHGGEWREGPKYDLFKVIKQETGNGGIIAEDLGIITPSVRRLLKQAAYPGMKVLQFAFSPDGKSEYLPQNYTSTNCVVYTATHDSDTAIGWYKDLDRETKRFCKEYLGIRRGAELPDAFIRLAWRSTADMAMTTIQELCGFGSEARINVPSTIGNNWRWRALESDFTEEKALWLNRLTEICNRKPCAKKRKIINK